MISEGTIIRRIVAGGTFVDLLRRRAEERLVLAVEVRGVRVAQAVAGASGVYVLG